MEQSTSGVVFWARSCWAVRQRGGLRGRRGRGGARSGLLPVWAVFLGPQGRCAHETGTYWGVTRSLCWVRSRARAGVCWPRAVGREGPRPAPALNPARGPGPQRVRNLTDLLFPLLFLGCQKSVCGCDSLSGKRHFAQPSAPGPVGRAPPRPSSGPAGGTAAPGARPPEAAVPRGEGAPLTP